MVSLRCFTENHYAIQIATGKDEKERLKAISQMVYGKRVDGFDFSMPRGRILGQTSCDEQFPFLILGKSISPFNPSCLAAVKLDFDGKYFIKKGL